ncbi:class I SAM-dependent methyltransferase [Mangrovitalea sediminis]|uniref:class I SAM-dependent methyltransferase n=1 Tax=Mangrovitalea sediminis TaxID=1982043 RepID=UPI00117842B5|nr:class I SAM-dependent methyltransferase [Mangrovitalea sediminis]
MKKSNFKEIMCQHEGQPKIFNNFIWSVKNYDFQDAIIPLRAYSGVAARMIEVLKYNVDIVYLDSAHEAGETFMGINLYYDLLREGGVIFGNDYNILPAARHDVDLFSKAIKQEIGFCSCKESNNPTWSFVKQ